MDKNHRPNKYSQENNHRSTQRNNNVICMNVAKNI